MQLFAQFFVLIVSHLAQKKGGARLNGRAKRITKESQRAKKKIRKQQRSKRKRFIKATIGFLKTTYEITIRAITTAIIESQS
jgi:hypothetical protein